MISSWQTKFLYFRNSCTVSLELLKVICFYFRFLLFVLVSRPLWQILIKAWHWILRLKWSPALLHIFLSCATTTLFYAFAQLSVVHLLFLVQIYRFCIVGLDAGQLRENIRRKKKDKIQNKINVNNEGASKLDDAEGLIHGRAYFRNFTVSKIRGTATT